MTRYCNHFAILLINCPQFSYKGSALADSCESEFPGNGWSQNKERYKPLVAAKEKEKEKRTTCDFDDFDYFVS